MLKLRMGRILAVGWRGGGEEEGEGGKMMIGEEKGNFDEGGIKEE